jgi:branched-chain amino acid transport system ATP-binding protein
MLEMTNVHSGYAAVPILFGINLCVAQGEVVALMGRNGMGKTTTLRTIFGALRPTKGSITFEGKPISAMPIHRIARLGLGLVPEGRGIFVKLNVRENMIATARPGPWTEQRVLDLFPRLGERAAHLGWQLSGGEQQMLAIGRALMTNPKILILDEATEGLAPVVRAQIWQALSAIKQEGQSILIVDKFLGPLTRIANRFYLLDKGEVGWTGSAAEVLSDRTTISRYLGV